MAVAAWAVEGQAVAAWAAAEWDREAVRAEAEVYAASQLARTEDTSAVAALVVAATEAVEVATLEAVEAMGLVKVAEAVGWGVAAEVASEA